jgi:hypothetical protein
MTHDHDDDDEIWSTANSISYSNSIDLNEFVDEPEEAKKPVVVTAASSNSGDQEETAEMLRRRDISLWRVFLLFLGFGIRAWGGPVVQIDLMRSYFVDQASGSRALVSIVFSPSTKSCLVPKPPNWPVISACWLVVVWELWRAALALCCPVCF